MIRIERSVFADPRFPLSNAELEEIFYGLAQVFDVQEGELSLRLVSDKVMAALNQAITGCLGPTNILSFPGEESGWLGDLVLSVDTLARETFLYNQDLHQYTIRLLAHGFLHLLGHDHGPEMDSLTDLAVLSLAQEDPYVMP
ncbi:MAG: rRNA maturation RNase YbeY [Desulfovibrionales bacterium]|nr:rRNA maturation RNase YbeY [Desulfovibrionales bacterium]